MGVLLLDTWKLSHNNDEGQQAQDKDQEEIGHHTHIEGYVITQPAATERKQRRNDQGNILASKQW